MHGGVVSYLAGVHVHWLCINESHVLGQAIIVFSNEDMQQHHCQCKYERSDLGSITWDHDRNGSYQPQHWGLSSAIFTWHIARDQ